MGWAQINEQEWKQKANKWKEYEWKQKKNEAPKDETLKTKFGSSSQINWAIECVYIFFNVFFLNINFNGASDPQGLEPG